MPPPYQDISGSYAPLGQQINDLSNSNIGLLQQAYDQQAAEADRLKEEAYKNPERTLSQALTQTLTAALPGLIGAVAGGQRGAGYGFQAGGQGANSLGLYYDKQGEDNKKLAQSEYANALRDKQQQGNEIDLARQRKADALLNLGIHQADEQVSMNRLDKQQAEENARQDRSIAAQQALAGDRETRLESQAGAAKRQEQGDIAAGISPRVDFTPGIRLHKGTDDKINGIVAGLDKSNDTLNRAQQFLDKVGSGYYVGAARKDIQQEAAELNSEFLTASKQVGDPLLAGNPSKFEETLKIRGLPLPKDVGDDASNVLATRQQIQDSINRARAYLNKVAGANLETYGGKLRNSPLSPDGMAARNSFAQSLIDTRSDMAYRRPAAPAPSVSTTQELSPAEELAIRRRLANGQ